MSQHTRDKIETTLGYGFLGIIPLGLIGMASPVAFGVVLGLGLVAGVLYVLRDDE
jgi:hypothetical protein